MAYTGTGTQEDPYLISTFADFLECIAIDGAYVKVTKDLDAATEGFEYIDPITIEATQVYADEKAVIQNVTILGSTEAGSQSFIYADTTSAKAVGLQKLHFKNWTLKAVNWNSSTFYVFDNPGAKPGFNITACTFEMEILCAGRPCAFMGSHQAYLTCAWSAFGITVREGDASGFIFNGTNSSTLLQYCNVHLYSPDASALRNNFFTTANVSGIIVEGFTLNTSQATSAKVVSMSLLGGGTGYSYIVLKNCVVPDTIVEYRTTSTAAKENLICLDGTDGETFTFSGITNLTPEQLKSEEYLQSIGWLP